MHVTVHASNIWNRVNYYLVSKTICNAFYVFLKNDIMFYISCFRIIFFLTWEPIHTRQLKCAYLYVLLWVLANIWRLPCKTCCIWIMKCFCLWIIGACSWEVLELKPYVQINYQPSHPLYHSFFPCTCVIWNPIQPAHVCMLFGCSFRISKILCS